ncbi:rubrerythrin family protein [Halomontanus rarus]|uniref:rubrerythrin family protein n=1 Tax=Halomontanus rarus TaxID=3034020 RepID=UPI0023E77804|nr:rubrerythrin family protein [Halovivax sp. TS33]
MDATSFSETLEDEMDVELERLGSSKLLVALTDAELDEPTVLRTAADGEHAAARTFEAWADDETDEGAREAFAELAARERDHYDRVTDALEGDHDGTPEDGAVHAEPRSLETTTARLGGLVGRALVGERTHLQLVSFFVNEGDETRAELFRELRADTNASRERALELLADVCETDEDWGRAREAAESVIQRAYDEYADSLEGLGVDPKPIC